MANVRERLKKNKTPSKSSSSMGLLSEHYANFQLQKETYVPLSIIDPKKTR